jgi:hypothetical protein
VLVKTPSTNFTFTKGMLFPFGHLVRSGRCSFLKADLAGDHAGGRRCAGNWLLLILCANGGNRFKIGH